MKLYSQLPIWSSRENDRLVESATKVILTHANQRMSPYRLKFITLRNFLEFIDIWDEEFKSMIEYVCIRSVESNIATTFISLAMIILSNQ